MTRLPAVLGGSAMFDSMIPVSRPTLPPYAALEGHVQELFETGMLTSARFVQRFEDELAAHFGVSHAVAVSSCTVALLLTYRALGLGGEVIVPSFTFMATVHPLVWNNVTPVFADVDSETWNLDPVQVEKSITDATSAIVAVHLGGTPADVSALEDVADRHGVHLIFDSAHGFGSLYGGQPLGRHGSAEVFSTTPTKVLPAVEGGIVATDDAELARWIRVARNYGNPGTYNSEFAGLNARMPEFNAIVGLASLASLEENVKHRSQIANIYRERLGEIPGITLQRIEARDRSSFKDFSVLIAESGFGVGRDALAQALRAEGVDTRFYYDPPVHLHDAYRALADRYEGRLPVTMSLAERVITIPIYSHMEVATADRICRAVEDIHRHATAIKAELDGDTGRVLPPNLAKSQARPNPSHHPSDSRQEAAPRSLGLGHP